MKTATEAKTDALIAWISAQPHHEIMAEFAFLLARITSSDKREREYAKKSIREKVTAGAAILKTRQNAANLATFANRHEP